jgi:hypothetical protein
MLSAVKNTSAAITLMLAFLAFVACIYLSIAALMLPCELGPCG